MHRTHNTEVINCSQDSNTLYIKLINLSPTANSVNLTVYDCTDSNPKIAYNTTLYLSPKSIKGVTFPLVSHTYDDCLNISAYQISYTTQNHFIQLSHKELSID